MMEEGSQLDEEEPTAVGGERRDLKPWSWLFLISIPVILILMFTWYWQFAVVSIFLFLPTLRLFWWWRENQQYAGPLDHVVSSYAQGFYLIFAVSNVSAIVAFVLAQVLLVWLFVIFSGGTWNGRGEAINSLIEGGSWAAWVLTEECWKATFAFWAKERRAHVIGERNRETKAWVSAATATAFGYATSQSILFVCVFTAILAKDGKVTMEELGSLFLLAFIFGAVSQPLSILCSYLVGLELTRDTPPNQALRWPAAIRMAYVFQFFLWLAVFGSVSQIAGLVFMFFSVVALYIAICKRILYVESQLPFEYMSEAARLRRHLGFALLDTNEQAAAAAATSGACDNEMVEMHSTTTETAPETSTSNPLPVLADNTATPKDIVEL